VSQGILPDTEIRRAIQNGDIEVDPFNPDHVNPVSLDLTLGPEIMVYKKWVHYDAEYDVRPTLPGSPHIPLGLSRADITGRPRDGAEMYSFKDEVLDVRDEPETVKFTIDPDRGWLLRPGVGYLMHTAERVHTKKYVPVLDGKSSVGRLFMVVHVTAGYGDPGFNGQYTLEVTVQHTLRIYPGMRIAQIRFHTIAGAVEKPYEGNYVGENARGPIGSKAYRQFKTRPR
jgi:dCTP deaminase